jgi:hypothetical protein
LAEAVRKRWIRGVVLYTGTEVIPFGSNLHGLPLSLLWTRINRTGLVKESWFPPLLERPPFVRRFHDVVFVAIEPEGDIVRRSLLSKYNLRNRKKFLIKLYMIRRKQIDEQDPGERFLPEARTQQQLVLLR